MDKVNVLVLARLRMERGYLDDIAALDPRISIKDATDHFAVELRESGKKGPKVNNFMREYALVRDWQLPGRQEDFNTLLAQAEVILGVLLLPENLLSRTSKLRLMQEKM